MHNVNEKDMSYDVVSYALEHIVQKVIHIRNTYEMRYTIKCNHVYITGGGSSLQMLLQMLTNSLQVKLDIINVTDRVSVPVSLIDTVKNQSPIIVGAAGLAMSAI